MDLDRSHLELLSALGSHGTLAQASAHLHLSPSAASRRLQEARRRVGVDLVEAHGRTVRLTTSGRLLAEAADDISRQIHEAQIAARWLAAGHESPVRIGVGFYDQVGWMLPSWTDRPFEVVRSKTHQAIDAFKLYRVDLAIGLASEVDPVGQTIFEDELVLAASTRAAAAIGTTATPEMVSDYRYLTYQLDPRSGYQFERFFLPSRCYPSVIVQVETFSTALEMVARDDAVTIEPRRLLEQRRHPGVVIIPLSQPVPVRWFAVRSDRKSEAADAYLHEVVQSHSTYC